MVPNFQSINQGSYTVVTTNSTGTNESTPALVYVGNPSRFVSATIGAGAFSGQFIGLANSNYVFQGSSDLLNWLPLKTNSSPIGIMNFSDPLNPSTSWRFYRARSQ